MPRRQWSLPFSEVKTAVITALAAGKPLSSDDLVAATGLPFEDVISVLRLLRHGGEVEFEPVWAGEGEMRAARDVRLSGSGRSSDSAR